MKELFMAAALVLAASAYLAAEEIRPPAPAVPASANAERVTAYRIGTARQLLDWSKNPAVSLKGPAASAEWETRRADLLFYLAKFHASQGGLETALNYQKRLLRETPVGPWTMEYISEYRTFLMIYNQRTGAALEEAIPEDRERIRRIERDFARSTDLAGFHERLAEYYFSTLNFDDAEKHIALALEAEPADKPFFRRPEPPKTSLRRLLRNLRMLEGDFAGALRESRTLIEGDKAGANENDYAIDSFLREASGRPLSPLDLTYKSRGARGFLPVLRKNGRGAGTAA